MTNIPEGYTWNQTSHRWEHVNYRNLMEEIAILERSMEKQEEYLKTAEIGAEKNKVRSLNKTFKNLLRTKREELSQQPPVMRSSKEELEGTKGWLAAVQSDYAQEVQKLLTGLTLDLARDDHRQLLRTLTSSGKRLEIALCCSLMLEVLTGILEEEQQPSLTIWLRELDKWIADATKRLINHTRNPQPSRQDEAEAQASAELLGVFTGSLRLELTRHLIREKMLVED